MPRHLFPGDVHLYPDGTPAANQPFTLWTDDQSGTQVTDVVARDGVSAVQLVTNADGLRPYLWGPNDVEVMYVDTGVSMRFPMYSDSRLKETLDESFLAGILQRLAALEGGGGVLGPGTGTGGGGNAYVIFGANAQRLDPATGLPLPAGASVIWDADTPPVNFVSSQDIWLNRP